MFRTILSLACAAILLSCQRSPAPPPAPEPPAARSVWDVLPADATAWATVDLTRLRADERFAAVVETIGSEAGAGAFENALGDADRMLIYATDPFFSDRVQVLEGDWDAVRLSRELTDGRAATGAMTATALGDGATLFAREGAPWVIGLDGGRLLATGPRDAIESLLRSPRRTLSPRSPDGAAAAAYWAPPELVRSAVGRRLQRPELAAPVEALQLAKLSASIGAGLDLEFVAMFADEAAAEDGQTAVAAMVAVLAAELGGPEVASWTDGLTLDRRGATVRAWWEFDRADVTGLLSLVSPTLTPPTSP